MLYSEHNFVLAKVTIQIKVVSTLWMKSCSVACTHTLLYFSFRSFGKHRRTKRARGPPCAGGQYFLISILSPTLDEF